MRPQRFRFLLIPAFLFLAIASWPTEASAQHRGVGGRLIIRGGFYGPVFFDPWYSYGYPYGYPGYGEFAYQYGYPYPPYGYYGRPDLLASSVRLEVTPKNAEVYVDGFRAGTVDDFNGFFQRLRMRPGEHELVLYLDGYRAVHQHLLLNAGSDQKVRYTMVPLASGEQAEPRPQPPIVAPENPYNQPPNQPPMRPRAAGPGRMGPPYPMPPQAGGGGQDARFGSVSIRVQPADADVLIDGERWSGPATQDRLVVQLSEGRHHVEIRKDGYDTYASDVDVKRDETVTLNVSLLRRSH